MRPAIGISLCLDARGRFKAGRETMFLDLAYARAVEAAGGLPVHLPMLGNAAVVVQRIDGLLIPGGDDFLPPLRGAYPDSVRFDPVPPSQIEFDGGLLSCAIERGLPVLGICYGMQLLALIRGGTLHHHLPSDVPDALEHRLPDLDGRHAIEVESDTRLAAALGPSPIPVNSRHHQAVATPGAGLRVSARSEDGVIEAIESREGSFCLGVQWHPERLGGRQGSAIFDVFVAACRDEATGGSRRIG